MKDVFRLFGSPFSAVFHQHLTYLRLKNVPATVYCATFASTKLYSLYHRCQTAFCVLTPRKRSCLLPWHLVQRVEEVEGGLFPHARRVLLDRRQHKDLHMVSWVLLVYSTWWLTLTGATYRWVRGDAHGIISGYMSYFLLLNGLGVYGPLREKFREAMCRLLSVHGVSRDTEPYFVEHFEKLCSALESHCVAMEHAALPCATATSSEPVYYLLGTPHPTLADLALASAFSGYFLLDDPPASSITEQFPALCRYMARCSGFHHLRQGQLESVIPSDAEEAREAAEFPDVVPESFLPVLKLVDEVLPVMVDHCEDFRDYMSGPAVQNLKKVKLEGAGIAPEYVGLEAYALPQKTDITSVFTVDKHILTVLCRAQDLEVATVAAREVLDEDLAPFNRISETASPTNAAAAGAQSNPNQEAMRSPLQSGDVLWDVSAVDDDVASTPDCSGGDSPNRETVVVTQLFSTKGRKNIERFSYTTSTARRSQSAEEILLSLRQKLVRMHTPQFTLHGVQQKKRIYVAVIPEHEMAKGRRPAES